MVTTTYVIRELDLLLCINVFGKASLAVTVRASMPSADTFVGFGYRKYKLICNILIFSMLFPIIYMKRDKLGTKFIQK